MDPSSISSFNAGIIDDTKHSLVKPSTDFSNKSSYFATDYYVEAVGNEQESQSVEDQKKAAADRLRREMEYIGVSLNNIIPTTLKQSALPSSSSSTESEDDGQRRCKKKAVKRIAPKSKFQREVMMTIAEGRSRRKTKQVDYNFSEYDSVIQEACEEMGDVNPNEREGEMVRPQGGAGRGKDMANIIEAEKKRKGSVDSTVDGTVVEGVDRDRTSQMGKPARSAPKPRRKLNDLNIDNRSDSDSEEYKASESEEEEADAEEIDSESDYVPSDEQKRTRRGGPRGGLARTQSDDDFVVSGSDDDEESDYRGKRKKIVDKKIKKKGRWEPSESDSEEEESYGYSDDSEVDRKRKKKEGAKGRWKAKESSEESDAPRTKTGRPLRRAVARSETKKVIVSDSEDNEDEGDKEKQGDGPVGPLDKQRKRKIESDSDEEEFKPDEEEEEEAENYEDESEEDEESIEKETEDDSRDVHDVIRKKGLEDDDSNDSNDLDLKPKVKKRKAANDIGSSKKITQKLTSKTEPSDLSDKTNGPGKLHAKKETPVQEIGPPLTVVSVKKEFTTPNQPLPTREVERKPVISSLPIPAPVSVAAMPNPYAAPGHYPPPPNPYYQGPSPVSGIHMPPYSMPNPYPSPYHQGPHPQFRPGPYAPPRVDIQHGYPTQIHNPYGQPPTSLPPGENGLRDLRSL